MIKYLTDYTLKIAIIALIFLFVAQFVIVIMRFIFSTGLLWLQDSLFFAFAIAILWSLAYFYQDHLRLRIDVFYQYYPPIIRQYVDFMTQLLIMIPFSLLLLWACYDFTYQSIIIGESSSVHGGVSFIYILKLLLFIFPLQLLLSCGYVLYDFIMINKSETNVK